MFHVSAQVSPPTHAAGESQKTLADRTHACTACGLTGGRDLVSALLAAHVQLTDPDDPTTARLDVALARNTQILFNEGLQEALSSQPQRGARPTSRGRTHAAARHPSGRRASARRNTAHQHQPTPDETPQRDHAGKTARARARELVGWHPLITG